jgi:hypothetical protein
MNTDGLNAQLAEFEARLRFFNEKLKPIASHPISTWEDGENHLKLSPPLGQAGIRTEAENVLAAVIELYESTPDARQPIRDMFARYTSVNWALWPPQGPTSEDGFRTWLLRISIDYKQDTRDVMMRLGRICHEALTSSVKIEPILKSVAEISSDVDPYGLGSVRKILLMAPRHYKRWRLPDE